MRHGPSGYGHGCRCYICERGHKARERRLLVEREGRSEWAKDRKRRQWPLTPLLAYTSNPTRTFKCDTAALHIAEEKGLNDWQADVWALRTGVLPGDVWPEWYERGLTPLDDIAVHGSERGLPGWRPAYEYQEAS